MFSVNWVGKEKEFSSKDHAIKFMERLDDDSDLWFGTSTLLRSRYKEGGEWKTKVYNYDGEGEDYVFGESAEGTSRAVKFSGNVIVMEIPSF